MIVDGNIDAINPDELSNGVMHWHKNKKMDDLMNFLASYVCSVHTDWYFRKVLLNYSGGTSSCQKGGPNEPRSLNF